MRDSRSRDQDLVKTAPERTCPGRRLARVPPDGLSWIPLLRRDASATDGRRPGARAQGRRLGRRRLRRLRRGSPAGRRGRARDRAAQGRRVPGRLRLDRPPRPEPRGASRRWASASSCTRWRSRTPSTPTSGRSSRCSATRCSSCSRPPATSNSRRAGRDRRGDGVRRAGASWSPSATARAARCTTCASTSRRTRTSSASGRARSSTPSPTASSTTTPRCSSGSTSRSTPVEAEVFSRVGANPTERIYKLKREVLEFKRAVAPLVAPMQRLATDQAGLPLDPRTAAYFRDVNDHLIRDAERIAGLDELLTGVLQANFAQLHRARQPGPAQDLELGRDRRGADDDLRPLRHELRPHARARLAVRLPGACCWRCCSSASRCTACFKRSGWL